MFYWNSLANLLSVLLYVVHCPALICCICYCMLRYDLLHSAVLYSALVLCWSAVLLCTSLFTLLCSVLSYPILYCTVQWYNASSCAFCTSSGLFLFSVIYFTKIYFTSICLKPISYKLLICCTILTYNEDKYDWGRISE